MLRCFGVTIAAICADALLRVLIGGPVLGPATSDFAIGVILSSAATGGVLALVEPRDWR